ncbi:ABC transporter substrate-binding protein [Epibacterium sp. SM1979]|uniref:ABC transporter substrate-binding protein n=1 Tax=Tritonibacter litoralis TaxID=2662264 RepID=A0A843YI91_9RHOB|nr:ABC transporter substrate-binding protein [Tritonibacter litoralis]MQQ10561.1 ABC transporter substrate-binding protein [Tritonibacter litoralis]
MTHSTLSRISSHWLAATLALAVAPAAMAQEEKTFKLGVVSFLSGGASGPFGVPSRNAAELLADAINNGTVPAPYDSVGFAGTLIEPVFVDEASKNVVADYQRLVQKDEVDAIVGYNSSGSCVAIAPEVEKLETLTVMTACGTSQIFEEIVTEPHYLFRAASHATMDNVAAARYVVEHTPAAVDKLGEIAGINQNYSWGLDSWRDFSASIQVLKNDVGIANEQFPKIFAGQYGAEISALLTARADVVHSSFWGGDLEALVIQGAGRGLFGRTQMVLTSSDTAIHRLGRQIPDGTIIGARGSYNIYAPDSELNSWFRQAYFDRYGVYPVHPAYQMVNAMLGMKAAADKAGEGTEEAIIANLKGLSFDTPGGIVDMALAGGHQAITGTSYGTYKFDKDTGLGTVENIVSFKAECINPPAGLTSQEWIKTGFEGADCD